MSKLNSKWQKLIVWLTGYLNIIAFILGGGYIYLKTEDEEVKTSAKTALALVIVFTVIEIFILILSNFINMGDNYNAINGIYNVGLFFKVIKAIAFTTLCVLDLFGIQITIINKLFKDKDQDNE